jgi:outer membrane protein OmpA-like peptidoglycan-associated protein
MALNLKSLSLVALVMAAPVPVMAEEVKTEAVIISHNGGQIHAKSRSGDVTVVYSSGTKIRETSGLKRTTRDGKSLIPGLIIEVEGDQQGGTIHATEIDFKQKDWRAAIASKAGTHEEFAQNAAELKELRQAIIDGHEYVIQDETTVYFPVGKSTIAPEYQAKLRELAQKAPSHGNYRISILGFADPTGNAAANERLSMKRAMAVSNFVRQSGHIEPGRVLSPSAMGEGTLAPGEAAPAGNTEARRVLVRVVTPKSQLKR